jgi:tRNA/rRNA methyltransferase
MNGRRKARRFETLDTSTPQTTDFPEADKRPMENVGVVLFQPSMSENIGTTARAMANMGLGPLTVVKPYRFDRDIMLSTATRAGCAHIESATVTQTLEEALADYQYVVGTTARRGSHRGPFLAPRPMAGKIMAMGKNTRVALLFGPERAGLTTAELRHCQAVVRIPTADPKTGSLNLAQAVLILGYELLNAVKPQTPPPDLKPAPMSEVEAMYDALTETLLTIGFLPDENTDHWLMSFKRIFNRSGLTHGDCNLLRGMCRQIHWALENKPAKQS